MRFHRCSHCCAQGEGTTGGGGRMHRPFGLFGPRRRMFDRSDVRLVILKLISEKPSHGYEIIKAIEDRLGGAYAPSPGIVYPALTLLEEQGLIRVDSTDGPRKLYAITPEGGTLLERNCGLVEAIFGRIAEINARQGGGGELTGVAGSPREVLLIARTRARSLVVPQSAERQTALAFRPGDHASADAPKELNR